MPLEILAILVVVGVSLIVFLVHFMGWSETMKIPDEQVAVEWFHKDFQAVKVNWIEIDDSRTVALLLMREQKAKGLIVSFGDKYLSRMFPQNQPLKTEIAEKGLIILLEDFTCPKIEISLRDQERREAWRRILA